MGKKYQGIIKQTFLLFLIPLIIMQCNLVKEVIALVPIDENNVSQEDYDALLFGSVLAISDKGGGIDPIEIGGYWNDGYYFGATYYATGKLVISANPDGSGSWATTDTSETWGYCLGDGSTGGNGTPDVGNDVFYRIIEYNNGTNTLYAQQSQSCDNNYGARADNREKYLRIVWTNPTNSGCENGASICFNYCQLAFGSLTLADAKADASTADSSDVQNTGCGGAAWSRALIRGDTETWN